MIEKVFLIKVLIAIILLVLFFGFSAFSELTKEDLEAIRSIVNDEIAKSEKIINAQITGIDKRLGDMKAMMIALVVLIVVAVTAPAAIVYRRDNQRPVASQQQVANEMAGKQDTEMGPSQVHTRKKIVIQKLKETLETCIRHKNEICTNLYLTVSVCLRREQSTLFTCRRRRTY